MLLTVENSRKPWSQPLSRKRTSEGAFNICTIPLNFWSDISKTVIRVIPNFSPPHKKTNNQLCIDIIVQIL